jgi:hypothetical protein
LNDRFKEDEMGKACREKINSYRILEGNPRRKKQLGRQRHGSRVIRARLIWLRIGTSKGLL